MLKKRKSKLWLWILTPPAIVLLIIGIWILTVFIRRPRYLEPDTADWQTGQIFFSVGDSWKSVAVRSFTGARDFSFTDSTPSHCGIVLREPDGLRLVHESTSARHIVAESPKEYLEKNGSYCLYTLPAPCPLDTNRLRRDIYKLQQENTPFDFNFDHNDSTSLYCSELVVTLLEKNGCMKISSLRSNNYIYPQDLLNKCLELDKSEN